MVWLSAVSQVKATSRLMDWEAERALKRLEDTGQITVVVQDNGSLHKSEQVQAKWREWQDKGLYFFFLPKYCSQMNLIEPEWHQLKTHELAGRMFEDEYDASDRCYGRNRRKKPASRILHRAF